MSTNDQYALNWGNHINHIRQAFETLLSGNEFTDVTLSCEGQKVGAHKIILSACSAYFHDLFRDNPCQHPIVILKDVKFQNLLYVLKFIYKGEVSVETECLDSFLKTAELLQICGLTEEDNFEKKNESTPHTTNTNKIVLPQLSKETVKRRRPEKIAEAQGSSQKKKKDNCGKEDVKIKEEHPDNLESEHDKSGDPLELEEKNNLREEIDLLQAAGSQDFGDTQMTNVNPPLMIENETVNDELRCKICEKQFSHPLSLRQHLPVHMGNTQCWICGAVLSRKYHLKLHMKTRHPN